jgi:serine/threonine protein kinase
MSGASSFLAKQEALVHSKVTPHPNIAKLVYSEESEDKFSLVIEKCSHGDYLEKKLHNVRDIWLCVIGL